MSESVSSEDRLSRLCRISFSMASLFGSALRVVTRCFERWSATEQKPRSCQREVLSNHNGICTLLLRFYFIRFNNKTRHKQKPADHKTEWHEFDRNSGMMFNDTDIWMWGLFLLYFSTRFGQKVSLHGTRCSLTRASECGVYFYCTFEEGPSESQSTWHAVFRTYKRQANSSLSHYHMFPKSWRPQISTKSPAGRGCHKMARICINRRYKSSKARPNA